MDNPPTLDLPTLPEFTTETFGDDTAVLATDSDPVTDSQKLQINLATTQNWFKKMEQIQVVQRHIHQTKRNVPQVQITNVPLPREDVKYLGLHLDR
jgi:hypothetical protein